MNLSTPRQPGAAIALFQGQIPKELKVQAGADAEKVFGRKRTFSLYMAELIRDDVQHHTLTLDLIDRLLAENPLAGKSGYVQLRVPPPMYHEARDRIEGLQTTARVYMSVLVLNASQHPETVGFIRDLRREALLQAS